MKYIVMHKSVVLDTTSILGRCLNPISTEHSLPETGTCMSEMFPILCFRKDHYRVHKSPSLDRILSQINPSNFLNPVSLILARYSKHLRQGLPSGVVPSVFYRISACVSRRLRSCCMSRQFNPSADHRDNF
jgi:hypothetical protein